ncbi:MFS transporter [Arthrobacter castelli]|uniref:MFS transporter n=1 Tax=Arthrobacter castelli TaxID=271431 RepID=UPI0004010671|nr:MFS transporter [Arthrobacter castelli]
MLKFPRLRRNAGSTGAAAPTPGNPGDPGNPTGPADPASETHQARPPRLPIPREIRVLIAAAFVIALGYGLVSPVLPQFAQSFNVGVAAASVIVSAFAFTRLIFAPVGGQLIGKLGERPVYITGLLIVAASTGACAFAQGYWQLLVFRGLGGIGSTMFTVSAMGLIIRLAPPTIRGRVSSAYASAFLLGSIGGPVLGGLLAGFGLRVPFVVYALALIVAAAVVFFRLKDVSLGSKDTAKKQEPMGFREAFGDSAYRSALVSSFANGWSSIGVRVALIPLFAGAALGAGPELAGIALAVFAAGNAAALTFSGRLADSIGRKPMVITGLVVNGLATGAIGFTTSVWPFLVVSVIAGLGSGLLNPAQQAVVADVVGNDKSGGKVLAAFQMMADTGGILGPILAGFLADRLSYTWAFGLTGLITLGAAGIWLNGRETVSREPAREPD